jgi:hypothetical protein
VTTHFIANVDNWDLCVFVYFILSYRFVMWSSPHQLVLMGPSRILDSDIIDVPGYRLLERAKFSVEQPQWEEAAACYSGCMRRTSSLVDALQTILL